MADTKVDPRSRDVRDDEILAPGHRACPGCGTAIAIRTVMRVVGRRVIVVTATGCLETFTSPHGYSAWEVPWVHSLFENAPAVASGVAAALRYLGRTGVPVVAIGGDGSSFDIGFGALSGMLERGDDVLYVCYDNEGYMNTGFQRSGATPYGASTSTTPAAAGSLGKTEHKKDLARLVLDHDIPYVATASIAFPADLMAKVRRALAIKGPRYIQIHCPCCLGWGFDPSETVRIARLGVQCGLVPIWEQERNTPRKSLAVRNPVPVEEYLRAQKRFSHLFDGSEEGRRVIREIQLIANRNLEDMSASLSGAGTSEG
ncbi:MAG TPA: hypothetical protein GX510_09390 [Firmicutes bacterium]|nr:hypothetical protein [Candidatus Fermentithermobacillaceae bacterium]